jgi:aspartate aminotransferase
VKEPDRFPISLSERVGRVAPSLTLAVTARAKELQRQGIRVIAFGAGEPDFPTPEPICEAGIEAIRSGKTRYTPEDGIPELKDAVAEIFYRDFGIRYSREEIAITVGAKQAIFNLLMAVLNPGDGVLIPSPYWVSYPEMVRLLDGEPQIVPTDPETGFRLRREDIEKAINSRTRGIILNSPSNPTGHVMDEEELKAILDLVRERNLWVISDEIYNRLTYDGVKALSPLNLAPDLRDRIAVVNGVSKTYAMTGWRIGYMAGPREWIRASAKVQGQSTSNPTSISQYAALKALALDPAVVERMRATFERRRNLMAQELKKIPGVELPVLPQGAFYLFPRVEKAIERIGLKDDLEFSERLLIEGHVAVVPGVGFGAPGYIRLSYATSEEEIFEGCKRIARFIADSSRQSS